MDQLVTGNVRLELHQKVFGAKVCDGCGQSNPWDALDCSCGAALAEGLTVKEDRGLVASSEGGF